MSERLAASFRDPSGFVFRREGRLLRQVNQAAREDFHNLHESGLYDALVQEGLLVRHEVVAEPPAEPDADAIVIAPEVVPFVSYPYEWCPAQLRAAAEATLRSQVLAMKHGMTLRDASAYNVQFVHNRPVLIDTLSFGRLEPGEPWIAYGQFCRHFLAPLALVAYTDVRLAQLLRVHIDGVPLDLAARLLPRRTRYKFGLGVHLHAHASSQRRHANAQSQAGTKAPRVSQKALEGLVDSLLTLIRKLTWEAPPSAWRDYYAARESYSESSLAHKTELVAEFLESVPARVVWDLGANTGHFSQLAARVTGADVVALEMDPSAVQIAWQELTRAREQQVLPLWCDLSNPAPSQGWAHTERDSLRARGPADVALALALVHHLAIGNNVPLDSVLAYLAQLTSRLIVEWVPKDDPMVIRMLKSRQDVFSSYTTEEFERACNTHFRVVRQEAVKDSVRTLYLLEPR